MAPEQALGLEVDGRADLWSFGVVMFEAFSGKKPFEGATDLAIMMAANQGRRARVANVAPHLPPDVAGVIEKLLEPNRDGRFQSAGDVLEALSNHPAPVRGRRVIAAMLQSIGAATAATALAADNAPATTIEPAPSFEDPSSSASSAPSPAASVPPPAVSTPSVPPSPRALDATPLVVPVSPAEPHASMLAATLPVGTRTPSPGRSAAFVFMLAAIAGLLVSIVIVVAQPFASRVPSSVTVDAEPRPLTSVGTAPPPTATMPVAVEPPIARGVLVPDEDELPPVPPETPSGSSTTPRTGAGTRPATPPQRVAASAEIGSLHVTVIPWGDVQIDGTARGRSPVTIDLPAGEHRVRIESESGAVTREVRIEAGRREELEVDLSDG